MMKTKNSLKVKILALPLLAVALIAAVKATAQSTVDWENLPSISLDAQLASYGWGAGASQMAQSLRAAAAAVGAPADLVFGALDQESRFSNYGVNYDFGNYSCGIAQSNISVWCAVANANSSSRSEYAFPDKLECDDLQDKNQAIMAPMLNGVKATRSLNSQGAMAADFQRLDAQTMIAQMPGDNVKDQTRYYQAAMSFVNNCSKSDEGLKIATTQLKLIYDDYIPDQLKRGHNHTAWVMADAIYNIGPVLTSMIEQNGGADVWQNLTPQTIIDIESNLLRARPAGAEALAVTTPDGVINVGYFQICVNQRHIEHVMRSTLPASMKSIINASTEVCPK